MSATSGTFDSQFTTENSTFWPENEKKTKLKNAFSAENKTGRNHHKSIFSAPKTKPKFGQSLLISKPNVDRLNKDKITA